MTCRRVDCRHEFCWLCLKDYKNHGKCEEVKIDNQAEKTQLDHYVDHYARYTEHRRSLKSEYEKRAVCTAMIEQINEKFIEHYSPDDNFLKKAYQSMLDGRRTLIACFMFSYFLAQSNSETGILKTNIDYMQHHVEQISKKFQ